MGTHIIYHGGECHDGFGAAWAAWRTLGDKATYAPASYGTNLDIPTDTKHLYLLDFSFPKEIIESLVSGLYSGKKIRVTIIDHHKTAIDELRPLLETGLIDGVLDATHSGAVLTHQWFDWGDSQNTEAARFLAYIEDRDLWKLELSSSKEFTAALRSYPLDFKLWNELSTKVDELILGGKPILRAQGQAVDAMCKQARYMNIGGYEVPVVNAAVYFSEVGARLLKMFPSAPFSAYYFDRGDSIRQWGFRSGPDFDCSAVAKKLGGGGHPQAAGFTESVPWKGINNLLSS